METVPYAIEEHALVLGCVVHIVLLLQIAMNTASRVSITSASQIAWQLASIVRIACSRVPLAPSAFSTNARREDVGASA